jgi:hypothetical protein
MNLPAASIRRPVTALMVTLIAILLGAISYARLPIDLMPEIVYPTISVRAEYPGVAPEEMENLVARPLEEALSSAPGVEKISSSSSEGSASIRIAFEHGVNLDEAANELAAGSTGAARVCRQTCFRRSCSSLTCPSSPSCSSRSRQGKSTRRNSGTSLKSRSNTGWNAFRACSIYDSRRPPP